MKATVALPLLIAIALLCVGCTQSTISIPDRYAPEEATAAAMKAYDTNSDGKIAGAELDKCLALKSAVIRVDTDKDQAISKEELLARLQLYEKGSDAFGTSVSVFSKGQPLQNAEVTLEPESFMGEDLPVYTLTTDETGSRAPKVKATGELATMPPGFYKVSIHHAQAGTVERGVELADDVTTASRMMFSMQEGGATPAGGGGGRR